MNKHDLLTVLNAADCEAEVYVTGRDSKGKHKLFPVTSVAVCGEQIQIQFDEKDNAFAAFMSETSVKNGTIENFKRVYVGMWGSKLSFALNHFQNKYSVIKGAEPFIDYLAYCDSIFQTDFHAIELEGHIYIFKKE